MPLLVAHLVDWLVMFLVVVEAFVLLTIGAGSLGATMASSAGRIATTPTWGAMATV